MPGSVKKKLLLHICCGPCAVYVVEKLQSEYEVTGFFYNPNIQPSAEYRFRKGELEKLAETLGWVVVYPPYDPREWFEKARGMESELERGARCPVCFRQRLAAAFRYAREHGIEAVATTLSISPYKVTEQINREGIGLEREFGISFLPENFKKRDGYRIGRRMAKTLGAKHQEYCGCLFSLHQRPRHRPKEGEDTGKSDAHQG